MTTRDRLVAVLADSGVLAIQEDDVTSPMEWIAHFPDESSREAARAGLQQIDEARDVDVQCVEIADDDWARRTQADLPAIQIGRVRIAPPWDLPETPGDLLVIIEPSRGFGTGHHQSTRLCVTLLQSRNLSGLTVTDVGTGSGVLAIVAAKLGAARVEAIDVDPDAIENARENIETNGVAGVVRAHVQDLTEPPPSPADVVTANLTGTLLVRHAQTLAGFLKRGGVLIASGFNVDERQMVQDAFESDLLLTESAEEDDWCAFVLTRP